jgi:hypothetical protein
MSESTTSPTNNPGQSDDFDPSNRAWQRLHIAAEEHLDVISWQRDDGRPVLLSLIDLHSGDIVTLAVIDSLQMRDPHALLILTADPTTGPVLSAYGPFDGATAADNCAPRLALEDPTGWAAAPSHSSTPTSPPCPTPHGSPCRPTSPPPSALIPAPRTSVRWRCCYWTARVAGMPWSGPSRTGARRRRGSPIRPPRRDSSSACSPFTRPRPPPRRSGCSPEPRDPCPAARIGSQLCPAPSTYSSPSNSTKVTTGPRRRSATTPDANSPATLSRSSSSAPPATTAYHPSQDPAVIERNARAAKELTAYLAAVIHAMMRHHPTIAAYLSPTCPECGQRA